MLKCYKRHLVYKWKWKQNVIPPCSLSCRYIPGESKAWLTKQNLQFRSRGKHATSSWEIRLEKTTNFLNLQKSYEGVTNVFIKSRFLVKKCEIHWYRVFMTKTCIGGAIWYFWYFSYFFISNIFWFCSSILVLLKHPICTFVTCP